MLFKKYTKWIPIVSYESCGLGYMVFARKNKKTGMIKFKSKNITIKGQGYIRSCDLPVVDISQQWERLNSDKI